MSTTGPFDRGSRRPDPGDGSDDPYVHLGPGGSGFGSPGTYGQPGPHHVWIWSLAVVLILLAGVAGSGAYGLAGSDRLAWVPGLGGDRLDDVWLDDIEAQGKTIVASGIDSAGYGATPAVFVSTDAGASWARAAVEYDGSASVRSLHIVLSGAEWALLGQDSAGAALVWTSNHGQRWNRMSTAEATAKTFTQDDTFYHAAPTTNGYVIVGTQYSHKEHTPVVWTLSSGDTWRRNDGRHLFPGATTPDVEDVAARGNVLLVSGWVDPAKGTGHQSYWRSTNGGETWQPASPPPKEIMAHPSEHVAAFTSGFVVLGRRGWANVAALTKDGRTWSSLGELPSLPSDDGPAMILPVRVDASDAALAILMRTTDDRLVYTDSDRGRSWDSGGDDSTFTLPGENASMEEVTVTPTTILGVTNGAPGSDQGAQILVAPKGEAPEPADLSSVEK